jgi:hypothetical protein
LCLIDSCGSDTNALVPAVCSQHGVNACVHFTGCVFHFRDNDSDSEEGESSFKYKDGSTFGYAARCVVLQDELRKHAIRTTGDPTIVTFRKPYADECQTDWFCLYCTEPGDPTVRQSAK